MSVDTTMEMHQGAPGEGRLGVIDAYRLGWRFMKKDFWRNWTLAFVFMLLLMASGFVPFGQFIAGPPLVAGFVYVLMRRMDGHALGVGGLFEGFKQRFGQSIVAILPVLIVQLVLVVVYMVMYFVLFFPVLMSAELEGGDPLEAGQAMSILVPFVIVANLGSILASVFFLFFIFAPLAVWDHPQSGWEAAKVSMRMVRNRFWPALGFGALGWLIWSVASLGVIACCVGMFFTLPIAMLWIGSTLIYLYRSWTGQALVQAAGEAPAGNAGPIPPTDIQPPSL